MTGRALVIAMLAGWGAWLALSGGDGPPVSAGRAQPLTQPAAEGFSFSDRPVLALKYPQYVDVVDLSPDGTMLACGTTRGTWVVNVRTGQRWSRGGWHANSLAFAPDGKLLARGTNAGKVELLSVPALARQQALPVTQWSIYAVAASPDSRQLAACAADGTVQVWDIASATRLRTLGAKGERMAALAFSPDGKLLASLSRYGRCDLWKLDDGTLLTTAAQVGDEVAQLRFSPDGSTLAIASWGESIHLWRPAQGERPVKMRVPDVLIGKPRLREPFLPEQGRPKNAPLGDFAYGRAAISADLRTAAVALENGKVALWDVGRRAVLRILPAAGESDVMGGGVESLAFSADGRVLAVGNRYGLAQVWQLKGPRPPSAATQPTVIDEPAAVAEHDPPPTTAPAVPPATQPAFDPLAGLDLTIQQYKKGLDPAEEEHLKKMEDHLKESLQSGWKPTWSHLDAKLTDEQIESLSTAELGRKLFDSGLPARTLMLYSTANAGIRRLEVLYKGYKELFHRPDCWKGLVAAMDFYAAQLDVRAEGTGNVNAITGLMTVPAFYGYPAIRANITGHEREIIAAHVGALKKLSGYLSASAAPTGTDKPKPFFAGMAPSALIKWALALAQGLSEQQYQAARAALSHPKWAGGVAASDMRPYIDKAAIVLEQFANLPAVTQPAEDPPAQPPAMQPAERTRPGLGQPFDPQEQQRRDLAALRGYTEAKDFLFQGGARDKAAAMFKVVAEKYPETRDGTMAAELVGPLGEMAKEDARYKGPRDIENLPVEKRIEVLVFLLRDVSARERHIPGECNVLWDAQTRDTPAHALRKIGKAAVPRLLGLLRDNRPTRSSEHPMNGGYVLRHSDVGVQILEAVAARRFFLERGTGQHFSNVQEAVRKETTARINSWWESNRNRTEPQWIQESLSETGIENYSVRIESAERLIELEGPRAVPFFRERLKEEPDNSHVVRLLWQAGGKSVLEHVRPKAASKDVYVRAQAYRCLLEAGESQTVDVILTDLTGVLKDPNDEHRRALLAVLAGSGLRSGFLAAARFIKHEDAGIAADALRATLLAHPGGPQLDGQTAKALLPFVASAVVSTRFDPANKEWAAGWMIQAANLPIAWPDSRSRNEREEALRQVVSWWGKHQQEFPQPETTPATSAQPSVRSRSQPATQPAVDSGRLSRELERLRSENVEDRVKACVALGDMRAEAAIPHLIEALADEEVHLPAVPIGRPLERTVWIEAARALQVIGQPAVGPLREALQHRLPMVRVRAGNLLMQMGDPRGRATLRAAAKTDEADGKARWFALGVLARDKDATVVPILIEKLKNSETLWSAVWMLGEAGDPRATEPLVEALREDAHWSTEQSILRALGLIGKAPKDLAPVLAALDHERSDVRREAAEALGRMSDHRAVEPLIRALDDLQVRRAAAEALGRIEDPRALGLLEHLLIREADEHDRRTIAEAIGRIKKSASTAATQPADLAGPDSAELPGHEVQLTEALKGNVSLVAAARAVSEARLELGFSGVVHAVQSFRLSRVFYGDAQPETTQLRYSYLQPNFGFASSGRAVRAGERVIWIMRFGRTSGERAVKAIPDTPVDRQVVAKLVGAIGPDVLRRVAYQRALDRLVERIAEAVPKGWAKYPGQGIGGVAPMQWEWGTGIAMVWRREGYNAMHWKPGRGGEVNLWIMEPVYAPQRHKYAHPGPGGAQAAPAVELETWRGRRVFFWGGGEDWPTAKGDILAALKETDAAATPQPGVPQGPPPATQPGALPPEIANHTERLRSEPKDHLGAAAALGEMGGAAAGAVPALIAALESEDGPSVGAGIVRALGRIGDVRAVVPLLRSIGGRPGWDQRWMRHEVIESLRKMGPPAIDVLLRALNDDDQVVYTQAAWALGELGDVRALEPLLALAGEGKIHVSPEALTPVSMIGRRNVPKLLEALKDPNPRIRRSAAAALGAIRELKAIDPLIALLDDTDNSEVPCRALKNIGAPAVPKLIQAAKEGNLHARWYAAMTLGWIGDNRAVPVLIDGLSDRDWLLRQHAADALGGIGDRSAVEPLIRALNDNSEHVRRAAVRSLRRVGDPRALGPLRRTSREDADEHTRRAATEAIQQIEQTAPSQATQRAGASTEQAGQESPGRPGHDDFGILTLEIQTSGNRFLPMEPVPILIRLVNKTGKPVQARTSVNPGWGLLEFYDASGQQAFQRFSPAGPWPHADGVLGRRPMQPGETWTSTGYLYYACPADPDKQRGRYLLPAPGTYRLKAILSQADSPTRIESNVLDLEARKPAAQDARAYDFMRRVDRDSVDDRRLLTDTGGGHPARDSEVMDRQEELLRRFPDSRYCRYVQFSLGLACCIKRDFERGMALLDAAAQQEDFFMAAETLRWLVEWSVRRNDLQAARKHLEALQERFPDSEEAHVAAVQFQQAGGLPRPPATRPRAPASAPASEQAGREGTAPTQKAKTPDADTQKPSTLPAVGEASDELIRAMKGRDENAVSKLVKELLAGDRERAATVFSTVLRRRDLFVHRGLIIQPVGYAKLQEAVPVLVDLLNDPDEYTRSFSASALGRIGDRAAIGAIETRLRTETGGEAKYRMHVGLGMLGRPYAQYFICGLYDSGERRRQAINALGGIGDRRAVLALCRLLYGEEFWDGRLAARAVERLTGIPVRVPDRLRTMTEIRTDVLKWVLANKAECTRPIEQSPEAWAYSPLPALYVDVVGQLRKGMTRRQVEGLLGTRADRGDAEKEWYPADASGRSVAATFVREDQQDVLVRWWLSEFPESIANAVRGVKAAGRFSLRLDEYIWDLRPDSSPGRSGELLDGLVSRREVLRLESPPEAAGEEGPRAGNAITRDQAHGLIDALADEGFFLRAQRDGPAVYPGGTYVLRVGPHQGEVGPGLAMLRMLRRVGRCLDGEAGKTVETVIERVRKQLGLVGEGGTVLGQTEQVKVPPRPALPAVDAPPPTQPADAFLTLVRQAIAMKPQDAAIRGGQRPTGLDFAPMLAVAGQAKDLTDFPKEHVKWEEAIKALAHARKVWALAALLDHENVDAKVWAARALEQLADPQTAPALLAAAKANNYDVSGSESATVHFIYRRTLKAALEKITGLKLTPKGLRVIEYPQPREPRVITSDDHPERFPEALDFAKVEAWLARKYLTAPPTQGTGGEGQESTPRRAEALGGRSPGQADPGGRVGEEIGEREAEFLTQVKAFLQWGGGVDATFQGGETRLYVAARHGYRHVAEFLIAKGANVNAPHLGGRTPLHVAVAWGRADMAKLLIARGANLEARDYLGQTPLHIPASSHRLDSEQLVEDDRGDVPAIEKKGQWRLDMVALLAQKGADINAKDKDGLSPLHLALAAGHGPVAQLLASMGANQDVLTLAGLGRTGALAKAIESGADPDAGDGKGRTAVHYAAVNGRKEAVRLVLDRGARVDFPDAHSGRTPLHYAAEHGYADVAELLLARGAAVNRRTPLGRTSLHLAAEKGHLKAVDVLLSKGAELDAKDRDGRTPLHLAVRWKHKPVVERLVARGAAVNVIDNKGQSPLCTALDFLHEDVAKLLLESGADPKIGTTERGNTALYEAAALRYEDLVEQMLAGGAELDAGKDGWTRWHGLVPVSKGVLKALIGSGADLNAVDRHGGTILHHASERGNMEVVSLLIAQGLDVTARDEYGETPLHKAAGRGHKKVVELLISSGGDVRAKGRYGQTLLFSAAQCKGEILEFLIAKGADPKARLENGRTALHACAQRWGSGDASAAKVLLDHGVDINARDGKGDTALHEAAVAGHADLARLLIARGADIEATDKEGNTALHETALQKRDLRSTMDGWPWRIGRTEVAKALLGKGADVDARNLEGSTPLHLAVALGDLPVASVLLEHGADVTARDGKGRTPPDLAKLYKTYAPPELFSRAGPNRADSTGSQPATRAAPTRGSQEKGSGSTDPKLERAVPMPPAPQPAPEGAGTTRPASTSSGPAGSPPAQRVRLTAAVANIANLEVALDAFELDTGRYPTGAEGLATDLVRPAAHQARRQAPLAIVADAQRLLEQPPALKPMPAVDDDRRPARQPGQDLAGIPFVPRQARLRVCRPGEVDVRPQPHQARNLLRPAPSGPVVQPCPNVHVASAGDEPPVLCGAR